MEQTDLLKRIVEVLEELGSPYMLVGSFVSSVYGEPRFTQDIDLVADLRYGDAPKLCGKFPPEEYYISPEAVGQAIRTGGQFNIIHPSSGNKIDIMMPPDSLWGENQMRRRRQVWLLPDCQGYAATPEDIILSKMNYYREGGSDKHLRDITGILKVRGDGVDREYIERWSGQLGLTEIWQAILRRLAAK